MVKFQLSLGTIFSNQAHNFETLSFMMSVNAHKFHASKLMNNK